MLVVKPVIFHKLLVTGKKYNVYGTGHAVASNDDAYMAIALSF